MKKKALLFTSIGALVCTVGVTALAVGGANHLDAFPAKANPTEYSVTFNESNTTVEGVDGNYAICTTTARGNKVGVVGYNNNDNDGGTFTFNGASFWRLLLFDYDDVLTGRAFEFSHITGFAISFSGGLGVAFENGKTSTEVITSGQEYTELSFTPDDHPLFYAGGSVTVSSLTIMYSC